MREQESYEIGAEQFRSRFDDSSLQIYINQIGEYPLLSREDEYFLWEKISPGIKAAERLEEIRENNIEALDSEIEHLENQIQVYKEAKEIFINSNLRLVISIAKNYLGNRLPIEDLIQEGNLGLEHAVDKFDASKGFKFSTYATWWIKQSITRAIDLKANNIYIPVHVSEKIAINKRLRNEGMGPKEIEDFIGMDVAKQKQLDQIESINGMLSLDRPMDESYNSNSKFIDILPDASSLDEHMDLIDKDFVSYLLERTPLNDKERLVVELRYGLCDGIERTLEDVGSSWQIVELLRSEGRKRGREGLTRERVRQIHQSAIEKMRSLIDYEN